MMLMRAVDSVKRARRLGLCGSFRSGGADPPRRSDGRSDGIDPGSGEDGAIGEPARDALDAELLSVELIRDGAGEEHPRPPSPSALGEASTLGELGSEIVDFGVGEAAPPLLAETIGRAEERLEARRSFEGSSEDADERAELGLEDPARHSARREEAYHPVDLLVYHALVIAEQRETVAGVALSEALAALSVSPSEIRKRSPHDATRPEDRDDLFGVVRHRNLAGLDVQRVRYRHRITMLIMRGKLTRPGAMGMLACAPHAPTHDAKTELLHG